MLKQNSSKHKFIRVEKMKLNFKLAYLFFFVLIAAPSISQAKDEIYTSFFSDKAVSGYDVVAYFTEGKPVQGKSQLSTNYKGATWQFSSQQNLELFIANPEKYEPQYGGYCAYAVAKGDTASADPKQWSIIDGKLYLNYNEEINTTWKKDTKGYIESADRNWPNVLE